MLHTSKLTKINKHRQISPNIDNTWRISTKFGKHLKTSNCPKSSEIVPNCWKSHSNIQNQRKKYSSRSCSERDFPWVGALWHPAAGISWMAVCTRQGDLARCLIVLFDRKTSYYHRKWVRVWVFAIIDRPEAPSGAHRVRKSLQQKFYTFYLGSVL